MGKNQVRQIKTNDVQDTCKKLIKIDGFFTQIGIP
jgi:hypothetical protein